MEYTIKNHQRAKEVMADLREKGARCCLIYTGQREGLSELPKDFSIRAVLKDGRLWDIVQIDRSE